MLACDYRLRGGQTGLEMIAQLHAAFNDEIPAVIVTGDTAADRLHEAAAGGWPVLHKPVAECQLREGLERAIAQASWSGEPAGSTSSGQQGGRAGRLRGVAARAGPDRAAHVGGILG